MDTIFIEDLSKEYEINNNTDYDMIKQLRFYKTSDISGLILYMQYKTLNSDTAWKIEVTYGGSTLTATGTIADSAAAFTDANCGIDISSIVNGYCDVKIYFKQSDLHLQGLNLTLQ